MPLSRRNRARRRRAPSTSPWVASRQMPPPARWAAIASSSRARLAASSPTPGSSSSQSGRRPASSRARLARRFWPEERKRAGVAASRSRSNQASAGPSAAGPPARPAAKAKFSSTESSGLSGSAWPRKCSRARCSGASAEQLRPPQARLPALGRRKPASRRSRVDLPLPLGPRSTRASPGARAKREGLEHETAATHAGEVVGGEGRGRQGCLSADRR